MLLGMNLTSNHLNYKIQRKQSDSFTVFADSKKQCQACEKLSSVLEMWKFQETRSVFSSDHSYAQLIWGIFVLAPWFLMKFYKVVIIYLDLKPEIRFYTWSITSIYHMQKETQFYWVWQLKWLDIDVAALLHYASYWS